VGDRFSTRALVVSRAFTQRSMRSEPPGEVGRVLVAHNLLLGDTLMLSPLLAKLRARYPAAELTLLAAPAVVPLYASRPWGVRALAFKPSDVSTTRALLGQGPFDLAFVVGDNRYSWVAAAMGAQHIVAHAGDKPWTKDWFVDAQRPYSSTPASWGDMVADLADGPEPEPYARGDWLAPAARSFDRPAAPYVVLHVGASTPLKHWLPERWWTIAQAFEKRGLGVVWSAGRGEEPIVAACDPGKHFPSLAGALDLPQLWRLVAGAELLVAPDTGVAHLGRLAWTPTLTLFGPGSALLAGPGRYWRDTPWRAATVDSFPCRDQKLLFRRELEWVRRCARSTAECDAPRCMFALDTDAVLAAAGALLERARPGCQPIG
jgi:ADP-heptose:LPS heptosyltransferase